MKNILFVIIIAVSFLQLSCDKIGQPSIIITELDTNLFPGNFIDFEVPTFESSSNTLRNVLIEDYTGHKCAFCPPAADEAAALEADNPGRVFVASIHASPSPGGTSSFQQVSASGYKYIRDFTTPEGKEIAAHLSEVQGGIVGNPTGTVSRMRNDAGEVLISSGVWGDFTDTILNNPSLFPLSVNIQAKSDYYPSTGGVFIHTEIEFLSDLSSEYAIVIYAIENKIIDWQKFGSDDIEFYKHHNVHIGNVFAGESFGRVFSNEEVSAGKKFNQTFSYKIPDGLDKNTMHFQIYVYDKATEEILQVIEHKI